MTPRTVLNEKFLKPVDCVVDRKTIRPLNTPDVADPVQNAALSWMIGQPPAMLSVIARGIGHSNYVTRLALLAQIAENRVDVGIMTTGKYRGKKIYSLKGPQ